MEKDILINILNEQSDLSKEIIENKKSQEDLRTDFDSFVVDTRQAIKNLEDSSRLEFISTVTITVISVFVSAFAGYSIHKREYNAELAKVHFVDIKSSILPALGDFSEQLKHWNHLGKKIQSSSVSEILSSKSLDMFIITNHKKNKTSSGELDIDLFNDLIRNHYPELRKALDSIHRIHEQYNKKITRFEVEVKQQLLKLIPTDYRIVNSSDTIQENEKVKYGYPKNSLMIDDLISNLVIGILREIRTDSYSIRPRLDNDVLDLQISDDINEGRDVLYNTLDFENDKKTILEIIKKFNDNFQSQLIIQLQNDFKEFQTKVEFLSLIIKKLQLKTALKTSKSCNYLKDRLN